MAKLYGIEKTSYEELIFSFAGARVMGVLLEKQFIQLNSRNTIETRCYLGPRGIRWQGSESNPDRIFAEERVRRNSRLVGEQRSKNLGRQQYCLVVLPTSLHLT
jgi:hypothetical protein